MGTVTTFIRLLESLMYKATLTAALARMTSSAAGGKDGRESSSVPAEGLADSPGRYTSKIPSQYSEQKNTTDEEPVYWCLSLATSLHSPMSCPCQLSGSIY